MLTDHFCRILESCRKRLARLVPPSWSQASSHRRHDPGNSASWEGPGRWAKNAGRSDSQTWNLWNHHGTTLSSNSVSLCAWLWRNWIQAVHVVCALGNNLVTLSNVRHGSPLLVRMVLVITFFRLEDDCFVLGSRPIIWVCWGVGRCGHICYIYIFDHIWRRYSYILYTFWSL